MVLILVSRSSQLVEKIIIDRNSKEHTQNKVNQKELPQLKKKIHFLIKLKQDPEQKVLVNQKHGVSKQESFNLFLGKIFIQILYVYILRNTKPCQTQLILNCVLLSQMCINHPNILSFLKLISALGVFGLKYFHGFVVLGGRIGRIAGLVFCLVIKMWKNLYKKSYQTWQKTPKCSNRTQKKRNIIS